MPLAIFDLRLGEDTLQKPAPVAHDGRFDAIHLRNIHTQADDHFASRAIRYSASPPQLDGGLYRRGLAACCSTMLWFKCVSLRSSCLCSKL